jgi:hypothetical protein
MAYDEGWDIPLDTEAALLPQRFGKFREILHADWILSG